MRCICFSFFRFAGLTVAMLLLAIIPAQATDALRHSVIVDGHPMALWEKSATGATEAILLVHGRTWSALPDFDLQVDGEQLSLMDGLVEEGYAVFAVDLRGYGETPRDKWVSVPGGDHAAFLEAPRAYFIHELVAFLQGVSL